MASSADIQLSTVVVKVGGSLLDWPDLEVALRTFLTSLSTRRISLVPGGGAVADVVRRLDQCHHLGEETAHWLALRAATLNGHVLRRVIGEASSVLCGNPAHFAECWNSTRLPILDPLEFCVADEIQQDHLPHSWDVTTDSVAGRVAQLSRPSRLVLLKSTDLPAHLGPAEAAQRGMIDPYFVRTYTTGSWQDAQGFPIEWINLRCWSPNGAPEECEPTAGPGLY